MHAYTISSAMSLQLSLDCFIDKYRKNRKILDTQKFAVITINVEQDGFSWE